MQAAVMRANDAPLEIEDVRIDDPGPGEVLVNTPASGICHSDLSVIAGGLPFPPPCIRGHEPAGVVEEVGAGVAEFAPGILAPRLPRRAGVDPATVDDVMARAGASDRRFRHERDG